MPLPLAETAARRLCSGTWVQGFNITGLELWPIAVCTQKHISEGGDGFEEFLPCGSCVARFRAQSCGISLGFRVVPAIPGYSHSNSMLALRVVRNSSRRCPRPASHDLVRRHYFYVISLESRLLLAPSVADLSDS